MAKASNNRFPQVVLSEQATPPTPDTALVNGEWLLYMDTDNKLYKVDHTGTATEVGALSAVVATGAELDTGTDDAKFASAKALKDSHNVPSVAPSTSGNVLTSNGTDWTSAAPAGGGGLVLLEQYTASSSASLNFTTFISPTYDDYAFEVVNIIPATNGADFWVRMSTDGGSTYDSGTNYNWSSYVVEYAGGVAAGGASQTKIALRGTNDMGNSTAAGGVCGIIRLYSPTSTTLHKRLNMTMSFYWNTGDRYVNSLTAGGYRVTTAVNAIQFLMSTGNIASGTIRAYGVVKS